MTDSEFTDQQLSLIQTLDYCFEPIHDFTKNRNEDQELRYQIKKSRIECSKNLDKYVKTKNYYKTDLESSIKKAEKGNFK